METKGTPHRDFISTQLPHVRLHSDGTPTRDALAAIV